MQMQTSAAVPSSPVSSSNPWLKPSAYAERFGVSRQTVWNWARKGLVEVRRQAKGTGVRVRSAS